MISLLLLDTSKYNACSQTNFGDKQRVERVFVCFAVCFASDTIRTEVAKMLCHSAPRIVCCCRKNAHKSLVSRALVVNFLAVNAAYGIGLLPTPTLPPQVAGDQKPWCA